mmetsp:Transcript_37731/g.91801  ORF Transcript_37731/g.91801 Transcript_37731/m.91801 type:complete len:238 (+) Transcript_37731:1353-2066(+)
MATVLGLDGTEGRLVGPADATNDASFFATVSRHGGQGDGRVDLIQESQVDLREFAGTGDTGKERTGSVRRSSVQCGKSGLARQTVGGLTTGLNARGKAQAGRRTEFGHVQDVEDAGSVDVALGVINTEVGTLSSLERQLDVRCDLHRCFKDVSTVGGSLCLVDVELGVGELRSDLGRQCTTFTTFSFDGNSNGTSILLTLQRLLRRVVIVQKVLGALGDISKFSSHGCWIDLNGVCL